MSDRNSLSSISQPVPELPVADVGRAQEHYRDALAVPGHEMGAVSRDRVTIFFRKKPPPIEPAVHWVFADDVDATYRDLVSLGANIVDPLEKKP